VDIARVRTVVLAGGRSQRMGFDKLTALFAGEPLARRVARALAELRPLVVTTAQVAEAIGGVPDVDVVVTEPTAGLSRTLQLAHEAVAPGAHLAVMPCDLPFLDAPRVRAFVARVPDDADLAWPVVGATPGHPVLWSPRARALVAALGDDDTPLRLRTDSRLRAQPLRERDDAYVVDVDTPVMWGAAEARARSRLSS
jgi:CTP:molybdopterin cytidylyltransferase MocA